MENQPKTRQERQRERTVKEIRSTAYDLLVHGGAFAVSIKAIAGRMGMTGPALYRYYDSHEALMADLTADCYRLMVDGVSAARDSIPATQPARRLLHTCRSMRHWAKAHPQEFKLMFASPMPAANQTESGSWLQSQSERFGLLFLDQIASIWQTRGFPTTDLATLSPELACQLSDYSQRIGQRLPAAPAYVFLKCWIRLYGLLCMEVLGQLAFAFSDIEPVFEINLKELCAMLDLDYEPAKT